MKLDRLDNALAWMCLCHLLMPLGVVCGLVLCSPASVRYPWLYQAGLMLYYALLSSSLWRCHRAGGGWPFAAAFLPLAGHLLAAGAVLHVLNFWPESLMEIFLLGAVPMIAALVAAAAARLAYRQRRCGLMVALGATLPFHILAAFAGEQLLLTVICERPASRAYVFLFLLQAVLLWHCRRPAPTPDGVGLNAQSPSASYHSR